MKVMESRGMESAPSYMAEMSYSRPSEAKSRTPDSFMMPQSGSSPAVAMVFSFVTYSSLGIAMTSTLMFGYSSWNLSATACTLAASSGGPQ